MAFPTTIGVTWDISPNVALRPDASYSGSWADSTSTSTTFGTASASGSSHSIGATLGVLFYMRQRESLNVYFVPRFGYARAGARTTASNGNVTQDTTSNVYSVSGSFGAEHAVSRRFGVFGELGLAFAVQRSKNNLSSATSINRSTTKTLGSRASVGTIIYF